VEILKCLHEALHRKRPELRSTDLILHHNNVPPHKALCVKLFLAQELITELEHLLSSPDLAVNDF
jgi:hypothetical protein